jgi:hypothetical protein
MSATRCRTVDPFALAERSGLSRHRSAVCRAVDERGRGSPAFSLAIGYKTSQESRGMMQVSLSSGRILVGLRGDHDAQYQSD